MVADGWWWWPMVADGCRWSLPHLLSLTASPLSHSQPALSLTFRIHSRPLPHLPDSQVQAEELAAGVPVVDLFVRLELGKSKSEVIAADCS